MKLKRSTKTVLSAVLVVALALTAIVVPNAKEAEAASYKAYLCFATEKWNHRNEKGNNDSGNAVYDENGGTVKKASGAKFTDGTIKTSSSKQTFTVSLKGLKKGALSKDGGWNSLYIDTTIPGSSKGKVKVTKAVVKVDGKKVKTIKNPVVTPDPGATQDHVQIQIINIWNDYANKKTNSTSIPMPKKSISIKVTVKKCKC